MTDQEVKTYIRKEVSNVLLTTIVLPIDKRAIATVRAKAEAALVKIMTDFAEKHQVNLYLPVLEVAMVGSEVNITLEWV